MKYGRAAGQTNGFIQRHSRRLISDFQAFVARLFPKDMDEFTGRQSADGRFLFELGVLILRLGAALSIVFFWPRALRAESVMPVIVYLGCLLYLAISLVVISFKRWHGAGTQSSQVLIYLQFLVDVLFAGVVVVFSLNVESAALAFFIIPLLLLCHYGRNRQWLVGTGGLALTILVLIISCAYWGGHIAGQGVEWSSPESRTDLWLLVGPRLAAFAAVSVVLRIYRNAQVLNLRYAEKARKSAEEARVTFEGLHMGTQCGITKLNLNGTITYWNAKFEQEFATEPGYWRKQAGLPCYFVFHGITQHCSWCRLKWEEMGEYWQAEQARETLRQWFSENESQSLEIAEDFDTAWEKVGFGNNVHRERVDTKALEECIDNRTNWAVSNQLKTGKGGQVGNHGNPSDDDRTEDRLHLFHIYYGAIKDGKAGKITHVVESVSDVTTTVLEMPYLKPDQQAVGVPPEGLPPIGVVTLSESGESGESQKQPPKKPHYVLAMNDPKWLRYKLGDSEGPPIPKEELLGFRCDIAYGRTPHPSYRNVSEHSSDEVPALPHCACRDRCPVDRVKDGKAHKGMTDHPSPAMVTSVPLFGPMGEVRAVFEFIDDLSDLMRVENAVHELNAASGENDVVHLLLDAFKRICKGDRASLLEFHDNGRKLTARADDEFEMQHGVQQASVVVLDVSENPLAQTIITDANVIALDSLLDDVKVPDKLKAWSSELREKRMLGVPGPVLLIPLSLRQRVWAVIAVERPKTDRSAGRAFTEEQRLYARIFAGHAVPALVRARELTRRDSIIDAMKAAADVLSPEAALSRLVQNLEPCLIRGMRLSAYWIPQLPGQTAGTAPVAILRCGSATKHLSSPQRPPAERQRGVAKSTVCEFLVQQILEYPDGMSWPAAWVRHGEGSIPVDDAAYWVRLVPICNRGSLLGLLVAENFQEDPEEDFPPDVAQMLNFAAQFGAVVLGRFALLAQCMFYLYGHALKSPWRRVHSHAREAPVPGISASSGHSLAEEIVAEAKLADQEIDVAHMAWSIACGNTEMLQLTERVDTLGMLMDALDAHKRKHEHWQPDEQIPGDLPCCRCHPKVIGQVIQEFLANAFKYRTEDTPVILAVEIDGTHVQVSVKNEGHLKASDCRRAFEPFFRGENSGTTAGTGVGLWMVDILTNAHPDVRKEVEVVEEAGKSFIVALLRVPLTR